MADSIKQLAEKNYKKDVGNSGDSVWIHLLISKTQITGISLRQLLFQVISPSQVFEREKNRIEGLRFEANIAGREVSLEEIDSFYNEVKKSIENNEVYIRFLNRSLAGIAGKENFHKQLEDL
jgi:hypothetical protein